MSADKYPQKEIDYVTKRANEGASHGVIATELEYMCDAIRTVQYVREMREDLGLPDHDPERAKQFLTTDIKKKEPPAPSLSSAFRHTGVASEPALSVGAMNRSEKHKPVKKEREEAPVQKKERRAMVVDFKPRFVSACVQGKTYVFAGVGPMVCTEIATSVIAGYNLETIVLKEANTTTSPLINRVILSKFPAETIREVASIDVMKKILEKIEFGRTSIKDKDVPRVSARQPEFFDKFINSPDINTVADLLLYYSADTQETSITGMKYVGRAMAQIASEYAVVTGTDFKKALRLISDKTGRTKPEEYIEPEPFSPSP